MTTPHSPASSPRLPSPPPIAEDQIGPTSPGVSPSEDHTHSLTTLTSTTASRRIRPGTTASDMHSGPPVTPLSSIDSAFPLTEHLKALYHSHTNPANTTTVAPITPEIALQLTTPPLGTSKDIWLYELGRLLIQKTNSIIVALFQDSPPCSPSTCPEMRASEWQYLCAVHDPPKSCAAIDYCCHTLDWAATTLTSSKMFPSRLGLGSGGGLPVTGGDKVLLAQMKEIKNIFRRVYRIYAHAWFQHREMFWRVEGRTGLYVLFKRVCDEYGIIEAENYTIPAEAEGLEPADDGEREGEMVSAPVILQREQGDIAPTSPRKSGEEGLGMVDTTKRHRHTKSDFSRDPSAIIREEAEEDDSEALMEKPALDRQGTALRSLAELGTEELPPADGGDEQTPIEHRVQLEDEEKVEEEEGEEVLVGVTRTDTLRAEDVLGRSDEAEVGEEEGEGSEDVMALEGGEEEAKTTVDVDATVVEVEEKEEEKAAVDDDEVAAVTEEPVDEGDATVIEAEETQDKPAASGEEATKTVGD